MNSRRPVAAERTRMASLRDIAREVNVSVSLVSKVLNNRLGTTGVSEDTVHAIHRTAKKLGYRKNASAVALLQGRHNVFGVYIHRLGMAGSGIIDELLAGISTAALRFKQRQFLNFYESTEDVLDLCESAHPGMMDGLLLAGIAHHEVLDRLRDIRRTGLPIVTVHDEAVSDDIPNVGMDQVNVGRIATQHLLDRGARGIAHIVNSKDRFDGYRRALADAGIAYDPARVYDAGAGSDYSHRTGEAAIREFVARGVTFDAVFAQSDQEAAGCVNALCEVGRRVPDDVRVIGIDNAPFCELVRIPLSSVSQEYQARGLRAVELLMALVNGEPVASATIAPVVHPRESSR